MEKTNQMGTMPIKKLIIKMSVPMMISMFIQSMYNVVDSIFVAQISENALTAVSLAFSAQNLMISVAVGTGVGINALVSRHLGEKDKDRANLIANNGVFLAIMSYIVFFVCGLLFTKIFFTSQTNIKEIIDGGSIYLITCTSFSFGIFLQIAFERLLQSTGKTIYTMISQIVGAVINIVLDPILIFGMFGFPKMGILGAAIATVVGQIAAASLAIWYNLKRNPELCVTLKKVFSPDKKAISDIYVIGIPSIIIGSIGSVMTYGINKILLSFTETAAAVFGVYFKLQSFVFMPVFGLNNAIVPILGFNYGAKNKKRITQTITYGLIYATTVMLIGFAIMQIFPRQMLLLFKASENMLSIGIPALRIISICFIFAGYSIILGSAFQAMGHAVLSMLVVIGRQIIIVLPVAYLLSLSGQVNYVWWAFPISEVLAFILATYFYIKIYNSTIKTLNA